MDSREEALPAFHFEVQVVHGASAVPWRMRRVRQILASSSLMSRNVLIRTVENPHPRAAGA
jgi:hypothetical protein